MNTNRKYLKYIAISGCLLLGSNSGYSALLNISNEPLFLDITIDPNVLLIADDSSSMKSQHITSTRGRMVHPGDTHIAYDIVREPKTNKDARRGCPAFNVLAYRPDVTYTPWEGVNKNGNPYLSMTNDLITLKNPYEGYGSDKKSISHHAYFEWIDKNSNGVYDDQECRTDDYGHDAGHSFGKRCSDDPNCTEIEHYTTDAEKINYNNWHTYYRTTGNVAKKGLIGVVNNSKHRIGLGTLSNFNDVGTPIKDMDDEDSTTTQDVTDKQNLIKAIGHIKYDGRTPLRKALYRAGEYYLNGSGALFDEGYQGSPILPASEGGTCQRNFSILVADGYGEATDIVGVGNTDGDNSSDYDGGIYADAVSDTLADIAMYYYETDLSLPLADEVSAEYENMHQHMETFSVVFGVKGNISCNPTTDSSCTPTWPTTIGKDASSIDDMAHAAFNSRGLFLPVTTPQGFIDSFEEAMRAITDSVSSSAVAASSTSLTSDTVIYQANFNSSDWHSSLEAWPVSNGSGDTRSGCSSVPAGSTCTVSAGDAGQVLNGQNFNTGRVILTTRPNTTTGLGIPFRWPASYSSPSSTELTSAQVNNLLTGAASGDEDNYGQNLLNYLRGDQSNEKGSGGSFRKRGNSVLGDIINSAPAYVKAPYLNYPNNLQTPSYQSYQTAKSSRTAMLYVGANDGMLHGFDATTYEEKIAYVPSMVFNKLEGLSNKDYSHRFMVDGSPNIGDAFYDSAWHSVLVSGLRYGGQGIFALDVSTPANFTEANAASIVLWEYTDDDLGYTYSQPDIVKLNNGTWAAIFGNGYNNSESGDGSVSTTGHAYLYIVNIKTGALIKKIDTGAGTVGTPNGLATVTPVDADGDYDVDYIYAGDLLGNLWKFDLTSTSTGSWAGSVLFTTNSPDTSHPAQPITTRPSVAFHPVAGKTGVMVYFGTGRYLGTTDNTATGQTTQTFYGIWDDWTATPPAFDRTGTDYLQQTIRQEVTASGNIYRAGSDTPIDWSQHHGWYLDLTDTNIGGNGGERQTTNAIVRGDRIIFTTISPTSTPCENGGSSWLMELDLTNGGPLTDPPFDVNGDGAITAADVIIISGEAEIPIGRKLDDIITQPTIITSPTEDQEYKLISSSSGKTESITESSPGSSPGVRKSWVEISQ